MNFIITQESDIITVTVTLPKLQRNKETGLDINRKILRENNVKEYLRKSSIVVGECIKKDNLDNMGDRLTAVWKYKAIPQKKVDKAPKPVVSSTIAKRTKKTRKRSKPKDE